MLYNYNTKKRKKEKKREKKISRINKRICHKEKKFSFLKKKSLKERKGKKKRRGNILFYPLDPFLSINYETHPRTQYIFYFPNMSGAPTNQTDTQVPTAQAPQSARKNGKEGNHFRRHSHAGPSFKGATEGMNGQSVPNLCRAVKVG